MNKTTYVELKLNGTTVLRERTGKQLKRKLKELHLDFLVNHPKSSISDVTTNIAYPVGNIFEATL